MPQPNKIPRPFADSGDKNSIPDSSGSIGFASWQEGFPAITSEPFSSGGVAPKRADFNGIFNALSLATLWQQQGGVYAYDNTTDYEVGNVVLYSGDLYKCLSANGPSSAVKAPTDATVWAKVILTTATQSAAGYMSATDKIALDGVPMTYVPISGNASNPMTGNLFGGKTSAWFLSMFSNNSVLHIRGGNTEPQGAYIRLYGQESDTNPGAFIVSASGSGVIKGLLGKTDGTLTWDGAPVATIESGTWTPTFRGGAVTATVNKSDYYKIGKQVFVFMAGTFTSNSSGGLYFGGLPYTPVHESFLGKMQVFGSVILCFPSSNNTGVYFVLSDGTGNLQSNNISGRDFVCALIYEAA